MLQAARAVFAEKGYTQATLKEIARRAEFGTGTLYNYFEGGKEEMLRAVLDDVFAAFRDLVSEATRPELASEEDCREALHACLETIVAYLLEHRDFFVLLTREAYLLRFADDPAHRAYLQERLDGVVSLLEDFFIRGAAADNIHVPAPRKLAYVVLTALRGYVAAYYEKTTLGSPEDIDRAARDTAGFLTTLFLDGMRRA